VALDFTSAARLFTGSEEELATALGLSIGDLRAARATPKFITPDLTRKMAEVLIERGRGMMRVGEMLLDNEG
jgi:hypothetical protein